MGGYPVGSGSPIRGFSERGLVQQGSGPRGILYRRKQQLQHSLGMEVMQIIAHSAAQARASPGQRPELRGSRPGQGRTA